MDAKFRIAKCGMQTYDAYILIYMQNFALHIRIFEKVAPSKFLDTHCTPVCLYVVCLYACMVVCLCACMPLCLYDCMPVCLVPLKYANNTSTNESKDKKNTKQSTFTLTTCAYGICGTYSE